MLQDGPIAQIVTADTTCPKCGKPLSFPVKLSIENLFTVSMLLWTHENSIKCDACGSKYVPIIAQFDPNNLVWGIAPLDDKPLIENPNMFDVSKLKLQ